MKQYKINVKTPTMDLYLNQINLWVDGDGTVYNYGVIGLSHGLFGCIVARLDQLLETYSEKDILDKCLMNNCTVRMGDLDFKL